MVYEMKRHHLGVSIGLLSLAAVAFHIWNLADHGRVDVVYKIVEPILDFKKAIQKGF